MSTVEYLPTSRNNVMLRNVGTVFTDRHGVKCRRLNPYPANVENMVSS